MGADAVETAEGNTDAQQRSSAEVPPGSESRARTCRSSRNLGDPVVSVRERPAGVSGQHQTLVYGSFTLGTRRSEL